METLNRESVVENPLLERVAAAAHARCVADVNEDAERSHAAAAEFEAALHAAISGRVPLGDIAAAEQEGQGRAKAELRREVIRGIERGARLRREGQAAYEAAVRRGGRLGLGNVEMATAAEVTHASIRKVLDRGAPGEVPTPEPPAAGGLSGYE